MNATGLVLDDVFQRHDTGPGHPERPQRISALRSALESAGLVQHCELIDPQAADLKWVRKNHADPYIKRFEEHCRSGRKLIDSTDCAICPETFEIARLAAGAVLKATERVATGSLDNAFCAVRPPGHHAEYDLSMGFCMLNNVAIAARYLMEEHGLERILILDWDVHHGNGTQHSFEEDPRVFFCSMHGHPKVLYPGTGYEHERGRGAGEGKTLNLTFMPGAGEAEYKAAYFDKFLPLAREFRPQLVLVSAGFDAHRADPLAPIELESLSFEWLTRETLAIADQFCDGKLVSMLEGGYNLDALGESAAIHLHELLGA